MLLLRVLFLVSVCLGAKAFVLSSGGGGGSALGKRGFAMAHQSGHCDVAMQEVAGEVTNNGADASNSEEPACYACRQPKWVSNGTKGRKPVIFLSRHGQSMANVQDMIGMNEGLSPAGAKYAGRLGRWLRENLNFEDGNFVIVRSDMVRTTETVEQLRETLDGHHTIEVRDCLNEINAGDYEGYTFSEFRAKAEHEHQARKKDKLRYRYPRGESYEDVLRRVSPAVNEIRQLEGDGKDVLVVAHQATLRCVLALLTGLTEEDPECIPELTIPLHSMVRLERQEGGKDGKACKYGIVETFTLGGTGPEGH
uniref:Phosphoglycerate mutase (2,3-diphosphoglycerate-dependent) n=1 Tax=Hemiselmis tepida TaxID=464990 RepID=A0A7S0W461_9CRYP|mmetsp:Transcript_35794/g.91412  ORF Transcript_35794/g.91412 Transcript_35794/m.91412 type:complete len:309 (+) Transcript_35794:3-929(+)